MEKVAIGYSITLKGNSMKQNGLGLDAGIVSTWMNEGCNSKTPTASDAPITEKPGKKARINDQVVDLALCRLPDEESLLVVSQTVHGGVTTENFPRSFRYGEPYEGFGHTFFQARVGDDEDSEDSDYSCDR